MQTDLEYRIDMKKEKNFSETDFSEKIEPSDKKTLESLSDDEILQGFKDADAMQKYFGMMPLAVVPSVQLDNKAKRTHRTAKEDAE